MRILEDVELEEPCETYFLNLFGLPYQVAHSQIIDHYKGVTILKIHEGKDRGILDLEFNTKEELIKAIDLGTGELEGRPFFMRSSSLF